MGARSGKRAGLFRLLQEGQGLPQGLALAEEFRGAGGDLLPVPLPAGHLQGLGLVPQVHGADPPGGALQAVDLDDVVLPLLGLLGLPDPPQAAGDLLPEEEEGLAVDLPCAA